MADFFYLVATDMPAYYEMIFVMKKHRVFLEMATPTVNWCLTRNKVENCNHGPMKNRRKCVHMHPVKLRQEGMKEFMMQRLHHLNLDRAPPRMWWFNCVYSIVTVPMFVFINEFNFWNTGVQWDRITGVEWDRQSKKGFEKTLFTLSECPLMQGLVFLSCVICVSVSFYW